MQDIEAFVAMTKFLEGYWERNGRPDEIGNLLSFLTLLSDGMPADAAMWEDWTDACAQAKLEFE